jgi:transposase InsO family protein
MRDVLIDTNGNVAAAARLLVKRRPDLRRPGDEERRNPSIRRTLQRAYKRDLPPQVRARLKHGARTAGNYQLREQRKKPPCGGEYQADFKNLHVDVLDPQTNELRSLHVCFIRETTTGGVAGMSFSYTETSNALRFALFEAFTRSENRPLGGVPVVMQTDNGAALIEEILGQGLDRLGIDLRRIPRYRPNLNGMIESFNGALEKEVSAIQPAYTRGPTQLDGSRDRGETCAPSRFLIEAKVRQFAEDFTYKWRQDRLGALTCGEYFARHASVREIAEHELAWLLPAKRCKVGSDGVAIGTGVRYAHDALWNAVGEEVVVHFLPPDPDKVYIRRGDEFVCEAVRQSAWGEESKAKNLAEHGGVMHEWEQRIQRRTRLAEHVARASHAAELEFERGEVGAVTEGNLGAHAEMTAPDPGEARNRVPAPRRQAKVFDPDQAREDLGL